MDMHVIIQFLKQLEKNNNREWFEKNKAKYLAAKATFDELVVDLLPRMVAVDPLLATLDPKKLSFRIYRDVRFSKDKRPYKNNMGAGFSANGKMVQEPGYYLHIQPGNQSFIAGGFYMPDTDKLQRIRQEIDYNTAVFEKIINDKKFIKTFGTLDEGDKLKTAPKGYPKDHPHLHWLQHKSYIAVRNFSDDEVLSKTFIKNIVQACEQVLPLNTFLRTAIA